MIQPTPPDPASQPLILVADDDDAIREMIRGVLEISGYRVMCARNGSEGIKLLGQHEFACILSDMLMPERDGLELLMEARKRKPGTPIVVMSGGGHMPVDFYFKVARNLGAMAVLDKPFGRTSLIAAVQSAMSGGGEGAGGGGGGGARESRG